MEPEIIVYIRHAHEEEVELAKLSFQDRQTIRLGRSSGMNVPFGKEDQGVSRHQFDVIHTRRNWMLINRGRPIYSGTRQLDKNARVRIKDGMEVVVSGCTLRFARGTPPDESYDLVIQNGVHRRRFALGSANVSVGRNDDNDVVVKGEGVSKRHFEISANNDAKKPFVLRDVGSLNGLKIVKPERISIAPGESLPVSVNQAFRFGSVSGFIARHEVLVRRQRILLLASGIVLLFLLWNGVHKETSIPPCSEKLSEALSTGNMVERVEKVKNLAAAHDVDIIECDDCRMRVAEMAALVSDVEAWVALRQEILRTLTRIRDCFSRSIWARDQTVLSERTMLLENLEADNQRFLLQSNTLRTNLTPTPAGFNRTEKIKQLVRSARSASDDHPPLDWPELLFREEVDGLVQETMKRTGDLMKPAQKLDFNINAFFSSGKITEKEFQEFNSLIPRVMTPDRARQAVRQMTTYREEVSRRLENWVLLKECYAKALEDPSIKPTPFPPDWAAPPDLNSDLVALLNRATAKEHYQFLCALSTSPFPESSRHPTGYRWVETLFSQWPQGMNIGPDAIQTIHEYCRDYLRSRRTIWNDLASRFEGLADNMRLSLRNNDSLDPAELTRQVSLLVDEIGRESIKADLVLFQLPLKGRKFEMRFETVQNAMEMEWESLRMAVEGKLYENVREKHGHPAKKEELQHLEQQLVSLLRMERRFVEVGLLRANRIRGMESIHRRVSRDIKALQHGQ